MLAGSAGAFFALTSKKGSAFATQTRRVTVNANSEIGTIKPELHGHFAEHLGSCTYGGLWVGKNSSTPNINGYRKDAVEWLKALGVPVLRWPGGCFADDYHWRDGIGPVEKRPKRVNMWWGRYVEDNSFGTHEFIGLCRLIGAEPYLAGNLGSGTPAELRDWTEYCNYPEGSTLADERIANGAREPFKVKYWGVGNENWGCGGNMSAAEYAAVYKRYATFLGGRGGWGSTDHYLIACGPNSNNVQWSREFLETIGQRLRMVHGFAMHYYSRGDALPTKFTVENVQKQLSTFDGMEKAVVQQNSILRSFEPEGRIGLLVDEWGVWDRMDPDEEKRLGRLWQQITIRSAVASAMGLNVFHRHANKLVMGNIAQIVNVLHSMLLTEGDRCIRTPAYYAFDLMKVHRGRTSLTVDTESKGPLEVSVSASRQGGSLAVSFVNPKHDEMARVECSLTGVRARGATGRILTHSDFNACNTFDKPDTVAPAGHKVEASGDKVSLDLPPMSIVTAVVDLA